MDLKYSVLMTVYINDRADWFCESLDSMLNQTLPPDEVVIVCDGQITPELDDTLGEYVRRHPDVVRVYRLEKNAGLGLALRYGVERCSNEYIARMDADDVSDLRRCELQMALLKDRPELSMVGSNVDEFCDDIKRIQAHRIMPESQEEIMRFAKGRTPFVHPTFLFKKSELLAAGNYDDCPCAEDYDVMSRMLQRGCEGWNIQEPLVYVRVTADVYSRRGGRKYLSQMRKFNKVLYDRGFYNFIQYITRNAIQTVVCSIPNEMRSAVYKRVLRK